jgi:hypothetical protein
MRTRLLTLACGALLASVIGRGTPVEAGCGCDKPPPALSTVRPPFASAGDVVTIISHKLTVGSTYTVRFGSIANGAEQTATAVSKRDLADGAYKAMLEVVTPAMQIGPKRIRVMKPANPDQVLINVPKTDFTVMQAPLVLEEGDTETVATCYQAAVTRNNEVLIPLDISAIARQMIFNGLGDDYPLLFSADDVAIYNTQGFLMQLLGPEQAGIFAIDDPGQPGSLALTYDRHEFVTYREKHAHVDGFGLDPADSRWHTDGTYHVDHDHLVIAIQGEIEGYGPPAPGRTQSFTFRITTALAEEGDGEATTRTIQFSDRCHAPGTTPISENTDDDDE